MNDRNGLIEELIDSERGRQMAILQDSIPSAESKYYYLVKKKYLLSFIYSSL